ncbi:hypothetical protein [Rhizobium etli]|uniref:Uncharacterized protein n=1 Tax=Rhizobium etli TaxID=29449 RepID=A0A7W6VH82_RHIET|nr:hypothetical protein [Rhizobium etli]MBB4483127.1 hypothetical protein [Rhizobium etli]MBB4538955.1 hypothetical protein [Rhizobium etli]
MSKNIVVIGDVGELARPLSRREKTGSSAVNSEDLPAAEVMA